MTRAEMLEAKGKAEGKAEATAELTPLLNEKDKLLDEQAELIAKLKASLAKQKLNPSI